MGFGFFSELLFIWEPPYFQATSYSCSLSPVSRPLHIPVLYSRPLHYSFPLFPGHFTLFLSLAVSLSLLFTGHFTLFLSFSQPYFQATSYYSSLSPISRPLDIPLPCFQAALHYSSLSPIFRPLHIIRLFLPPLFPGHFTLFLSPISRPLYIIPFSLPYFQATSRYSSLSAISRPLHIFPLSPVRPPEKRVSAWERCACR